MRFSAIDMGDYSIGQVELTDDDMSVMNAVLSSGAAEAVSGMMVTIIRGVEKEMCGVRGGE